MAGGTQRGCQSYRGPHSLQRPHHYPFHPREEEGIEDTRPIIDAMAPLFHVRADAPPLILITGDREMEMLGRYEENAYMMRMMKVVGHPATKLYELQGYGHGMTEPAFPILIREIKAISRNLNQKGSLAAP